MPSTSLQEKEHGESYVEFLRRLFALKGVPQLMMFSACMSFGIGMYAIAPSITADKIARLHYGYDGPSCSSIATDVIPTECSQGSADAQETASIASLIQFTVSFFTGPLLGILSDQYGRKMFLFLGAFCFTLAPLALVLIQVIPKLDPTWFYVGAACAGIAPWFGPSFAIMADIVEPSYRAPAFSLIVIFSSASVPLIPEAAAIFGHLLASIVSFFICLMSLIVVLVFLPETLSDENRETAKRKRGEELERGVSLVSTICRPVKEMVLVNHNSFFRLISATVLLSGLVKAGERIVFIYFIEGQLGFDDQETANYILVKSFGGVLFFSIVMKKLVVEFGERYVVMIAMSVGVLNNILYGISKGPTLIYIGTFLSCLAGISYPTASSMMSYNVEKHEQGKVQGIFNSLNAVASATGPTILNSIFDVTLKIFPGAIFFACALFYASALVCSYYLPPEKANSKANRTPSEAQRLLDNDMEENTV